MENKKIKIKIKINGQEMGCDSGDTIFKVARKNNIFIPGLCGHPDFPTKANCRLCVVEVAGCKKLLTACSTPVSDGMEVFTETKRVVDTRNLNIELIFAEHIEKCAACIWRYECPLLEFARRYKIKITTFKDRKGTRKTYKFANAVELDATQCIDCRNCVDACSRIQNIHHLEIIGKGANQEIKPTKDKKKPCILCGQCAVHCPVSSAQEQASWQKVEKVINDKKKIVIAQFAPSIRVSVGEDFGLPYGQIATDQVVGGLRALGFNYVFDVSFGADVTTIVEAQELLERIRNKKLPMITSCCPGWVNYAEMYNPELISNLTTVRSPQIHNGGIIKTYWARKMKINPKNIIVVSIMPCTAKKYEITRPELKIGILNPVDFVLTTREFTFLLKKNNLNFTNIKNSEADNPLGEHSGAGVIFGASGGVMESALRTANFMVCKNKKNKLCKKRIDFKNARGQNGIKEATVDVGGRKLKIAIANEIRNAQILIKNIKKYDYVEIMACPGGCVGGGGQPIPTTAEIRRKRAEALYKDDLNQKIRISAENKEAVEILQWLSKNKKLEKEVLYTNFRKKEKC